ncbi:MAG: C25 family cysteine peptidase [Planctomycetota bacterium]
MSTQRRTRRLLQLRFFIVGFLLPTLLRPAAALAEPPRGVDTVVVCPDAWRPDLLAWVAHREGQGRRVTVIPPKPTAEETLGAIRAAFDAPAVSDSAAVAALSVTTPKRWVLLIGDAGVEGSRAPPGTTPTWFTDGVINPRWGSEPTIATDLPYADTDGDGRADAAVGRIACDSAGELRRYTGRVIRYESTRAGRLDGRLLRLVASPGRFSPWLDRVIEATAARILADLTPPDCDLHLTYADWRSPYCPYPPSMPDAVAAGLQQPALAWVYLGHGQRGSLDLLRTPLGHARLLDRDLVHKLQGGRFPPVAAIVACYAGAFDGGDDCLAEAMLKQPGGPLAVVAGSRVTMPYGNSALGLELLGGFFAGREETLGGLVAAAKRASLTTPPGTADTDDRSAGGLRRAVEAVAAGFTPGEEGRRLERVEHAQMYNLLGDPLLRVRRPLAAPVSVRLLADRPRTVVVTCESPFAGECRLRLKRRGPPAPPGAATRDEFRLNDAARAEYDASYAAANAPPAADEKRFGVAAGAFTSELAMPANGDAGALAADAGGWLVVAHIAGEEGLAIGYAEVDAPLSSQREPR